MAPTDTTTLRIPKSLRDRISDMADQRGVTMLEVVAEAINRLHRDEWWQTVHQQLDEWDEEDRTNYEEESAILDQATGDGLRDR